MATDEQEQTETERKYDVDAGFAVPDLSGSGGAVSMSPPDVQHLAATYYDTDDLRLIASPTTLPPRPAAPHPACHTQAPPRARPPGWWTRGARSSPRWLTTRSPGRGRTPPTRSDGGSRTPGGRWKSS